MGTERREHLVYRSDFTVPSEHWPECKLNRSHSFCRNGYLYIAAGPPSGHTRSVGIPINDFKVTVDAEFVDRSSGGSVLGVVFRNSNNKLFYAFNVDWNGRYNVWFFRDNEWDRIVPSGLSEFIKRNTGTNSLMVEMVGQKMTVSANGHVLEKSGYYS